MHQWKLENLSPHPFLKAEAKQLHYNLGFSSFRKAEGAVPLKFAWGYRGALDLLMQLVI